MRLRLLVAGLMAFALLCGGTALAHQSTTEDKDVLAPVNNALNAAGSGDVATLRTQYIPSPTFIDEFAPFLWTGPTAIDSYFGSAMQMYKDTGMTGTKVAHGAPKYAYGAEHKQAYVVVPLSVSAKIGTKPYQATGTLTFVLQNTPSGWRIAAQTWSKDHENIDPY